MKSVHLRFILPAILLLALGARYFIISHFSSPADTPSSPALATNREETSAPSLPADHPDDDLPQSLAKPAFPPAREHPRQARLSAKVQIPADKPLPEIFPHQAERDLINSLAITYNPSVIPQIAAYLTHADATVRAAALNALVQIGHPDAIPHLRRALAKARPPEADELRENIEFLSLAPAKI